MLAGILLAACIVPERWHMTAIFDSSSAGTIAQRLKRESFTAVAKSIPADGTEVGFSDLGWVTRSELEAGDAALAASLRARQTAETHLGIVRQFYHLEAVRAKMSCDDALARDAADPLALLTRARWHPEAGRRRAAIADYSAVLRRDPKAYAALYGRASASYAEGDYAAALADARAAVSANGGSGDAHTLLALIEEARGDDDLATAEAGDAIAQYRGRMADDSGARYALGVAYENLGNFAAAIDEFNAVLKKQTGTPARTARGFAWFSRGDLAKATDDFVAASREKPAAELPYLALATLNLAKGDAAASLGYARRALTASPHGAYAALWVLVASRSLHRDVPLADVETFAASSAWPAPAIRVFLGRAPVDSLEAAASSPVAFVQRLQRCEARFYGAVYLLTAGDRAKGLPLLRTAAGECPYREYERAAAETMVRLAPR
jgi:tetratricopeptide (TPR) repeat protein